MKHPQVINKPKLPKFDGAYFAQRGYDAVMKYGTEAERKEAEARRRELAKWPGR